MKDYLYNIAFFPLPIIWFMFFIIIFRIKKNIYFYFKSIFVLLFILSLPIFIEIISLPLAKGSDRSLSDEEISAIVVLTSGIYKDINNNWHPSSTSIARVILANNLSKTLNIPLIILGGKSMPNAPAESYIVSKFIENKNIILDSESKNTYESAINLEKILLKNNLDKNNNFYVVTSKHHNLRTAFTFKTQNYKIKLYEYSSFNKLSFKNFIPNSKSFTSLNNIMYEYFGIIKYIFSGHIKI